MEKIYKIILIIFVGTFSLVSGTQPATAEEDMYAEPEYIEPGYEGLDDMEPDYEELFYEESGYEEPADAESGYEEPASIEQIYEEPGNTDMLFMGCEGPEVLMLQKRLHELDYLEGEPDGYYGRNTENAVLHFQRNNNLEADGCVGDETKAALETAKPLKTLAGYFKDIAITHLDSGLYEADPYMVTSKRMLEAFRERDKNPMEWLSAILYSFKHFPAEFAQNVMNGNGNQLGTYTTGDSDLDKYCALITNLIISDSMTDEEKLYACYQWIEKNFSYVSKPDFERWQDGALDAFSSYGCDCYGFYASLRALYEYMGFECLETTSIQKDHYWVRVNLDGEWFHCDATNTWGPEERFLYTNQQLLDFYYEKPGVGSLFYEWESGY